MKIENAEDFVQACGSTANGAALAGMILIRGRRSPVGLVCIGNFKIQRKCVILFDKRFDYPFSFSAFERAWKRAEATSGTNQS
jgi:hypothetical protein